jgi:RNA polymerase sigma-70 factor (ECF subfamily)
VNAPTDEQLLTEHQNGDANAFRALVERYHRELLQFVFRFTSSKSAADDIVQDAFVQVHLSSTRFDPNRRFKPWLFTIAANKARDHLRSRTRRREVPLNAQVGGEDEGQSFLDLLADEDAGPDADMQSNENREDVRTVISRMPPHLAEALILAYYHHFPYREIAEVLDIPLGTVKSRLHAAVAQFGSAFKALQRSRNDDPP